VLARELRAASAAGAAAVGIVSVPARQAATKSFLVCFDALIAALLAAYSALHSETVFANAGALGNANNAPIAAAGHARKTSAFECRHIGRDWP